MINPQELISCYNNVSKFPSVQQVADHLNISLSTLYEHKSKIEKSLKNKKDSPFVDRKNLKKVKKIDALLKNCSTETEKSKLLSQIATMNEHINELKAELKQSHKEIATTDSIKNLIHGAQDYNFKQIPDWLNTSKNSIDTNMGIPVLFLSDIHFDEVVDASQIDYINNYNRDIAEKRLQYTFERAKVLLKDYLGQKNSTYDAFVLALGGDILSGNIHEELLETNETTILQSILRLTDLLISGISMLQENFGKVYVPCVVGNHGRLYKKIRAKNKVFDNFEYLVYQYLARYFKDNKNVVVHVSDASDLTFKVYNKTFLLSHGDAFKGGSGIAGIMSPLMLGLHRKTRRQSAVGKSFDVMMIGHFHQYLHTENLIVNGSMCGYNEYAYQQNFPVEKPQQAMFIVHPKYGITFRMPVQCDGYENTRKNSSVPISVFN